MSNAYLGRFGEAYAVEFLMQEGYAILETNYRQSFGEIDIVARDGATLCFIEVKTRMTADYGHPFEAVTRAKQRVIRKLAAAYVLEHGIVDQLIRFDVVGIFSPEGSPVEIELLKDAF